jgi:tetratricopeptide (TPR) repeat protein
MTPAHNAAQKLKQTDDAETHDNLEQFRARQGELPDATEHLQQIARINPDQTEARRVLDRALRAQREGAGQFAVGPSSTTRVQ